MATTAKKTAAADTKVADEKKTDAKTDAPVDAPKIADVQADAPVGQDSVVTRDPAADALADGTPEARWDYSAKAVADVNDGWTVQQAEGDDPRHFEAPEQVVGQAFVEKQLPDVDSQRAAGIDPEAYRAGLTVLDDSEAVKHPAGPGPDEARNLGLI